MGTLHQNRKGVHDEIKKAKLKKGNNMAVYKDKLMFLKRKNKKDVCLMSNIHDKKFVKGSRPKRQEVQSSH
jgi:hypothetical protein